MPRTKPQQIKPESQAVDRLGRRRRRRGGQGRAARGGRVPARPEALQARSAPRVPKGILLHGPPGTGKTLLAKAVAHESGANFFAQSAASFVEMFAGLGAARIRRLFARRARTPPAIIFIDELDAVGGHARHRTSRARRTRRSTSCWWRWTASRTRDDVVVIAASNLLEQARPGAAAPGPLRPPDPRLAARPEGPRGDPRRAHARQAAGADVDLELRRPPDQRADGRRPGQHLQRGGDLRRPPRRTTIVSRRDFDAGARARGRRHAVAPRDQRPREARRRLPRGRARAVRRAAPLRRPRCTGSRSSPAGGARATR